MLVHKLDFFQSTVWRIDRLYNSDRAREASSARPDRVRTHFRNQYTIDRFMKSRFAVGQSSAQPTSYLTGRS